MPQEARRPVQEVGGCSVEQSSPGTGGTFCSADLCWLSRLTLCS